MADHKTTDGARPVVVVRDVALALAFVRARLPDQVDRAAARKERLEAIPGVVPNLKQRIAGCVFASRCASARDLCRHVAPALEEKAPAHFAACHFAAKAMVAA